VITAQADSKQQEKIAKKGMNRGKVQSKQRRLAETNHLGSSRREKEEEASGGGEGSARRGEAWGSAAKL
jgi:hypothetical protein